MNYSMFLALAAATVAPVEPAEQPLPPTELDDALQPALQRLRQLLLAFRSHPVSPQAVFDLEQRLQDEIRELGRVGTRVGVQPRRIDPRRGIAHARRIRGQSLHARLPQDAADGRHDVRQDSPVAGWLSANAQNGRADALSVGPATRPRCRCQSRPGGTGGVLPGRGGRHPATHPATAPTRPWRGLGRKETARRDRPRCPGDDGGASRSPGGTTAALARAAYSSSGKHKPVLSLGRDGICVGVPVRGGTIFEVASAGTVTVLNRRGKRMGTVYLACMPESKQGTMSEQLTRLVEGVLQGWQGPLPRLCYVTDAGDNETSYYQNVLRRMRHRARGSVCTGGVCWTTIMPVSVCGRWRRRCLAAGRRPGRVRRMQQLLKKPKGIRRVLNSASVLRSRHRLRGSAREAFGKAYNYLRARTKYMDYACYERLGLPRGSGVTEAACKTIYTQRLKLSGMRWQKSGAQTILNLRVLLLSGVWSEAYRRGLSKLDNVQVPPYAMPNRKTQKRAS